METTKKQDTVLLSLLGDILKHDGLGDDDHEYKEWEVTEGVFGDIYLSTTVGLKNDEGTMAAIFARTHRLMALGPRGGVMLLNPGKYNKKSGKVERRKNRAGYRFAILTQTVY